MTAESARTSVEGEGASREVVLDTGRQEEETEEGGVIFRV